MMSFEDSEEFPGRLLHQAALWDNAELLEDLLHGDQISHLNCRDAWGRTPLHAAATTDGSQCLRILLQAGADPNIKSGTRADGRTCLHVAAEHGAVENVTLLLSNRADILAKDSHGLTALDLAEQAQQESCMTVLKQAADSKEMARQELHSSLRDACSRGDVNKAREILVNLDKDAESIINSSSNGSSTLLFRACEEGHKDLVTLLLEFNADGRIHPVTKYSPMYIASYYGRKDIVEILLKKFPKLVGVSTVEKWLPLHACIINGHVMVLELLLRHQYPSDVMRKFRDLSGEWEFEMAFDINARDVTGQSALYLACYVGNQKIIDTFLKYKVPAKKVKQNSSSNESSPQHFPMSSLEGEPDTQMDTVHSQESFSPSKLRISGSIQSLMTKLNLAKKEPSNGEALISPLNIDLYCNNNTETALHVAVKNKHHNVVSMLLAAKANPNLRMYLPDDEMIRSKDDYVFTGSTALVEACRNRDLGMLDVLLRYHARDDEGKALFIATQNKEELIVSKLLALKAHSDPEYKVNRRSFDVKPSQQLSCLSNMSSVGVYASLFPSVPVMINWHGQRCLSYLKNQWFIEASVNLNPKLKLNPRNQGIALYAITRLDISNNSLTSLPEMIFQLPSLRILNASQNKLENLPVGIGQALIDGTVTLPRKGKMALSFQSPISVIEEIHLKDNRLVTLPEGIFQLPVLQLLDVSNNKLINLPYNMWSAPKLREFNASLNLLHSLPVRPDQEGGGLYTGAMEAWNETSDEEGQSNSEVTNSFEIVIDDSSNLKTSRNVRKMLSLDKHGNIITCCRSRELFHHSLWSSSVQIQEQYSVERESETSTLSQLQCLNLSHNNFTSVPVGLPCLGVNLTRLYLAYNRLYEIGQAHNYPIGLKQLDLSHNLIKSWNTISRATSIDTADLTSSSSGLSCLAPSEMFKPKKASTPVRRSSASTGSSRSKGATALSGTPVSGTVLCQHRRHSRLENLRTLVLADNELTRLVVNMEDTSINFMEEAHEIEGLGPSIVSPKPRLLFPNLSMLDLSNNKLRELPSNLHEFTNLSVLNVAGNSDISELPPEMGLLSRLWNLNTRGCSLQEPLKSMIDSKKYKTMDVIGYLKSILEDARPYARMKLMIVGVQGIGKTSLLEQLRMEGTGSYRKRPVEHWAKRMGNKNINTRTAKGTTMSTVGVDIGDWIYEKKIRGQSNHGPVYFRTWDFGGQREYYATHQYFLSKRSLYLVVWNICDGEKGVEEILQWLVNIQARAPNSPVVIIGTHYDLIKDKFPPSWSEDLQQTIRAKFINVIDADKLGLPRVLDTIEVSCRTRHNVKLLCNLIYDTVFSLRTPGSKERLLEQKIPASYLALENVIGHLSLDRKAHGRDPVLSVERYQSLVTHEMASRGYKPFRDLAELNQASTFLHENGVLLHYEDVTLKDLYFLDPQWLCDMLAHVVTIREINPFVRNGLMRMDDLKHVFKSSSCAPVDAKSYIVNLLNKFEVALTWDNRTLLIPSLLSSEEQLLRNPNGSEIKVLRIPVKSRGWTPKRKSFVGVNQGVSNIGSSLTAPLEQRAEGILTRPQLNLPPADNFISSPKRETKELKANQIKISKEKSFSSQKLPVASQSHVQISHRGKSNASIHRLLLMSYFPSGFWSRLLTRILADESVHSVVKNYFVLPEEVFSDQDLANIFGGQAEWCCWQTGMELRLAHTTLFRIKEVLPLSSPLKEHQRRENCSTSAGKNHCFHGSGHLDYRGMKFLVKLEENWSDLEVKNSAILEIFLPNEALEIRRKYPEGGSPEDVLTPSGIQSMVLDPTPEALTKLLAMAVDHVDTLLEDWYPTLGTRFVHTSEGKFLVTRLVPCPVCLSCHANMEALQHVPLLPENWGSFVEMNPLYCSMTGSVLHQSLKGSSTQQQSEYSMDNSTYECSEPYQGPSVAHPSQEPIGTLPMGPQGLLSSPSRPRSWGSRDSTASDGDSGVDPNSTPSSRNPSAEGRPDLQGHKEEVKDASQEVTPVIYSFLVEECILGSHKSSGVSCPLHGQLLLSCVAPDVIFLDLSERHLIHPDVIKQGKLLGRGGFGFVFEATCRHFVNSDQPFDVALKMLQPVNPGPNARSSAMSAYKAAQSKWDRDSLQYACKAYCSARQEINILLGLNHPNIVPFIGVCPRPLAIVLALAPQGSLDQCLKNYRRSGARLCLGPLQTIVLQVAKALEYLHGQHIIYRDLKSENVLVWGLPPPFQSELQGVQVDVKVADYGISRLTVPTGAKGFGGTEGFMAPEMMKHNGEEEYTDKVDCFSFGMFMYELLTTHQPYESCDNVKEHVLEGGRPALTHRETQYPLYVLDLMVMCWAQKPRSRPSASQMVSIATAPEFTHLLDVVSLDHSSVPVSCAAFVFLEENTTEELGDKDDQDENEMRYSVWVGRSSCQVDILLAGQWGWNGLNSIEGLPEMITAMCQVKDLIWLGDAAGHIHGYRNDSYNWVFTYQMETEVSSSSVSLICGLDDIGRVAVSLDNGRLFLCRSDVTPSCAVMGEGSFILTELAGFTKELYSMAKIRVSLTEWALWVGGSHGVISVFFLRENGLVTDQQEVSHLLNTSIPSHDELNEADVLLLCASHGLSTTTSDHQGPTLWSAVHPGCVVYHWDARTKELLNRLDCSKLVPCSESLKSISIEEHLSPSHCQVTALNVSKEELYIGTTWGCIVVAEALTMRPITVFRPFEADICAIIPLTSSKNGRQYASPSRRMGASSTHTSTKTDSIPEDSDQPGNEDCLVATIGKGYRNLLGRYAPTTLLQGLEGDRANNVFCLLWKTSDWIN